MVPKHVPVIISRRYDFRRACFFTYYLSIIFSFLAVRMHVGKQMMVSVSDS